MPDAHLLFCSVVQELPYTYYVLSNEWWLHYYVCYSNAHLRLHNAIVLNKSALYMRGGNDHVKACNYMRALGQEIPPASTEWEGSTYGHNVSNQCRYAHKSIHIHVLCVLPYPLHRRQHTCSPAYNLLYYMYSEQQSTVPHWQPQTHCTVAVVALHR